MADPDRAGSDLANWSLLQAVPSGVSTRSNGVITMHLIQKAATGLLALSTIALVGCQNEKPAAESTSNSSVAKSVYDTGKLRALVIGDSLPMVKKDGDNYDGLSFVVLEAIRDQINVSPMKKDKEVSIEPVAANSTREGLDMIRSGAADIACPFVALCTAYANAQSLQACTYVHTDGPVIACASLRRVL